MVWLQPILYTLQVQRLIKDEVMALYGKATCAHLVRTHSCGAFQQPGHWFALEIFSFDILSDLSIIFLPT